MTTPSDTQPRGIWPPLLIPWQEDFTCDWMAFDENLERLCHLGFHGLYTLDTASEFFTMEHDEWEKIARRFVSRALVATPALLLGLGCTWTNMEGALHRVRLARDLGIGYIHLSFPYWLPLTEAASLRFIEEVQRHAGHLGVVLYVPSHAALKIDSRLYRTMADVAPCLRGSKIVGDDPQLVAQLVEAAPGHAHFVYERFLAVGARAGALGNYSSIAGASPNFMLDWWKAISRDDTALSDACQAKVNGFLDEAIVPLVRRGILGGSLDKALAQIGGAPGSRQVRPPYESIAEEDFLQMKASFHRWFHRPEVS